MSLPADLFRAQRWSGALAMNGKLVAILGQSQTTLSLHARQPSGAFGAMFLEFVDRILNVPLPSDHT